MAAVEVRRVEKVIGETGIGVENRTDVSFELGAEIGGAWVAFQALSAERVEMLQRRSRDLREREGGREGDGGEQPPEQQ